MARSWRDWSRSTPACGKSRLDRDQFAQTVMIAQGDFCGILNASSKDRKALFQKLFHTGLYAQLQERLRQEVGKLQDEAAGYAAAIAAARGQIVWPENAAPAEREIAGSPGPTGRAG